MTNNLTFVRSLCYVRCLDILDSDTSLGQDFRQVLSQLLFNQVDDFFDVCDHVVNLFISQTVRHVFKRLDDEFNFLLAVFRDVVTDDRVLFSSLDNGSQIVKFVKLLVRLFRSLVGFQTRNDGYSQLIEVDSFLVVQDFEDGGNDFSIHKLTCFFINDLIIIYVINIANFIIIVNNNLMKILNQTTQFR